MAEIKKNKHKDIFGFVILIILFTLLCAGLIMGIVSSSSTDIPLKIVLSVVVVCLVLKIFLGVIGQGISKG